MLRLIAVLIVLALSSVASAQTQVWWEGYYGGKYYPGRYYSRANLCCNRPDCQMRASILASINTKEAQARAVAVAPSSTTVYQTVTKYRTVKRCDGRRCWYEQEAYTVQVPVQVAAPVAVPKVLEASDVHDPLADTRLDSSPPGAVRVMLELIRPTSAEVLMDIGSGDGRVLIEAARAYGCTARGIELSKDSVSLSRERVRQAGLESLVSIEHGDATKADVFDADIVTMYLFPELIEVIWPKIRPGTLVVSLNHRLPVDARKVTREVNGEEFDFFICVKKRQ